MSLNKHPTTEVDNVAKKKVDYRRAENKDEKCSKCFFFKHPGHCVRVDGQIDPNFTCDLWE